MPDGGLPAMLMRTGKGDGLDGNHEFLKRSKMESPGWNCRIRSRSVVIEGMYIVSEGVMRLTIAVRYLGNGLWHCAIFAILPDTGLAKENFWIPTL